MAASRIHRLLHDEAAHGIVLSRLAGLGDRRFCPAEAGTKGRFLILNDK